jgi:hydroxymethylpyrimidine pyrophosphatase-like HAD family hydrolase
MGSLTPQFGARLGKRGRAVSWSSSAYGRKLSDLKSLVRDIGCVDAVVAENGAVIAFPNGQARQLAAPPPAQFLRELAQQGIPFSVGQCVVEADATWAHQILERHPTPQIFLPRRRDCIHADQCYDRELSAVHFWNVPLSEDWVALWTTGRTSCRFTLHTSQIAFIFSRR